MKRFRTLYLLVAVAALVPWGCGSGEGPSSPGPGPGPGCQPYTIQNGSFENGLAGWDGGNFPHYQGGPNPPPGHPYEEGTHWWNPINDAVSGAWAARGSIGTAGWDTELFTDWIPVSQGQTICLEVWARTNGRATARLGMDTAAEIGENNAIDNPFTETTAQVWTRMELSHQVGPGELWIHPWIEVLSDGSDEGHADFDDFVVGRSGADPASFTVVLTGDTGHQILEVWTDVMDPEGASYALTTFAPVFPGSYRINARDHQGIWAADSLGMRWGLFVNDVRLQTTEDNGQGGRNYRFGLTSNGQVTP